MKISEKPVKSHFSFTTTLLLFLITNMFIDYNERITPMQQKINSCIGNTNSIIHVHPFEGMVPMETTGERIRQIREEKKMTQEQLAKAAGISKGFLSDVETKNKNISSQSLLKIANVLEASLDFLLRGEETRPPRSGPVVIPPELSQMAREFDLSYSETQELLLVHDSVVGRRGGKPKQDFTVDDWKNLYQMINK